MYQSGNIIYSLPNCCHISREQSILYEVYFLVFAVALYFCLLSLSPIFCYWPLMLYFPLFTVTQYLLLFIVEPYLLSLIDRPCFLLFTVMLHICCLLLYRTPRCLPLLPNFYCLPSTSAVKSYSVLSAIYH